MSLKAAKALLMRGFSPIPVPIRSKAPELRGWQNLRLTEAELRHHFSRECNIGVLLGEPSGGIVDVDIDDEIALEIADRYLPPTGMEWGRESRPRSHRLYRVVGAVKTTKKFAGTQVELRWTGAQTIAPGSVHPSGELVRWDNDGEPAEVTADVLRQALGQLGLAAAALRMRRELVQRAVSEAAVGERNDIGFRLARNLRDAGVPMNDARTDMAEYAGLVPQREGDPYTEREALASLEQAYTRADVRSRGAAPRDDRPVERARVIDLSTVEPEEVRWLCPGFVPLGKVSLLAGDPGLGKSMVALDIAAAVSRGRAWREDGDGPLGDVVVLSAEDGAADTILPRLLAAEADPKRIALLDGIEGPRGERDLDLDQDLQHLGHAIQSRDQCRLVIIDPVTAYWGKADAWREADVRRVLRALSRLAADAGVAVLCVAHLNKRAGLNAVGRVGGSVGLPAAARVVHVVIRDPDDPDRRLLLPAKNNLAADQSGFAYRIRSDGGSPSIEWESEPVTSRIDEILSRAAQGDSGGEAVKYAVDWLREALERGPVPSSELLDGAIASGISNATYRRAREQAGVQSWQEGKQWITALPHPRARAQLRICAPEDQGGTEGHNRSQSEEEGAA